MRLFKKYSLQLTFIFGIFLLRFNTSHSASPPQQLPDCSSTGTGQVNISNYANYYNSIKRSQCLKNWAVLVFMEADNDLSPYATLDLYEMEAGYSSGNISAGSTSKTDIIAEVNQRETSHYRRLHLFQSKNIYDKKITLQSVKNLKFEQIITSPVISTAPKISPVTTTQRLENFLSWAIKSYPSKNYSLILWGHGNGSTGVLRDDALKKWQSTKDVFQSIVSSLKKTLNKPLDLLIWDACLMQTLDVLSDSTIIAQNIVGSPQVQLSQGLPYRRFLYELNHAPSQTPENLAKTLPSLMKSSMGQGGLQSRGSSQLKDIFSISAATSVKFKNFKTSFNTFSKIFLTYLQSNSVRSLDLSLGAPKLTRYDSTYVDFLSFLELTESALITDRQTSPFVDHVRDSLESALKILKLELNLFVITQEHGKELGSTIGVSIWFPNDTLDLQRTSGAVRLHSFYTESSWDQVLKHIFKPTKL